ncbi:MAG: hypothetical protein RIC16_09530 [Rhodospirillales bacterium]
MYDLLFDLDVSHAEMNTWIARNFSLATMCNDESYQDAYYEEIKERERAEQARREQEEKQKEQDAAEARDPFLKGKRMVKEGDYIPALRILAPFSKIR